MSTHAPLSLSLQLPFCQFLSPLLSPLPMSYLSDPHVSLGLTKTPLCAPPALSSGFPFLPLFFSFHLSACLCLCFPTSLFLLQSVCLVSVTGTHISHRSTFTQFLQTGVSQSLCVISQSEIHAQVLCMRGVSENGSRRYIWDVSDFPCTQR